VDPISPGSPFYLPKGVALYNGLVDFVRALYPRYGYQEVITPQVFRTELFKTSGHYQQFRDGMFLMQGDEGEELGLKPMNCPGHCALFSTRRHSYRELPIRFAEFTRLHRNERSGTLTGLSRVRSFAQDDAHIYCMESQIPDEVKRFIALLDKVYNAVGLKYAAKFSTRPEQRIGDDALWDRAEAALKSALESLGLPYELKPGEGAFYGPKIDFDVSDSIGRKWQLGTIQLDYNAPERFDLTYIGEDNAAHRPVVLHRAVYGSFERFIAILIEHFAGAFPVWLAPVQATLVTVADRHLEYAGTVLARLQAQGYRVELDDRRMTMQAKFREAQLQKIPFTLVIGDKEVEQGAVAPRRYSGEDLKTMPLERFEAILAQEAALP
jgi:threonyl-tRNA synthetase